MHPRLCSAAAPRNGWLENASAVLDELRVDESHGRPAKPDRFVLKRWRRPLGPYLPVGEQRNERIMRFQGTLDIAVVGLWCEQYSKRLWFRFAGCLI